MRNLLPLLALLSLGLAGCSGSGDGHAALDPVNCPGGQALSAEDLEDLPGHHDAGFNATTACPRLPSVSLTGLPAELGAYKEAAFTWTLDNGSVQHGHSMLASLRWSTRSVADIDLTSMNKYPDELVKREHQDVPAKFEGKLMFTQPGKVFVRAYAQIQGDGLDRQDFWSPEAAITILPVEPTGVVVDVTHGPGDFLGEFGPAELSLQLGDAVRLVNDDLVPHTCTSATANNPGDIAAPRGEAGEPVVFRVPATYEYTCDDRQPRSLIVRVAAPA